MKGAHKGVKMQKRSWALALPAGVAAVVLGGAAWAQQDTRPATKPPSPPPVLIEHTPLEDRVATVSPPVTGGSVVTSPRWVRHPSAEFPQQALDSGITKGRATINCGWLSDGVLSACRIQSESPEGAGFGEAALAGATHGRLSIDDVATRPAGSRVVYTANFDAIEEPSVVDQTSTSGQRPQ